MPLAYPLARETFFDVLPIASMNLHLPEAVALARTAGGEQLPAELGERLWTGQVTLGPLLRAETGRPEVLIDLLRGAGRSFLVYDRRRPAPLSDPAGAILGAAAPVIDTLGADTRELRVGGLPVGYQLSAGDYLSFSYGSAPLRYALHRVVDPTVTAAAGGLTPFFEVTPYIRPGAVTGAAVTLLRAYCKAQLIFGSVAPMEGRHTLFEGQSFGFMQTLR